MGTKRSKILNYTSENPYTGFKDFQNTSGLKINTGMKDIIYSISYATNNIKKYCFKNWGI